VRPPTRESVDGRSRLAGDLVGDRRDHDVSFAGIGLSPGQQGVAFADAGVAHGVAFHAVGEVVPVLPGRSILYWLDHRGRSGGERELRQVHVEAGRVGARKSVVGAELAVR
jgi:hypothetical protein